jgi:hypothetical protein
MYKLQNITYMNLYNKAYNGDLQASKLHLSARARTNFDVTNSNEVYKAHEIISKIWHKLIQNIILSVFVLYKKIYYITIRHSFEKSEMQDKYRSAPPWQKQQLFYL